VGGMVGKGSNGSKYACVGGGRGTGGSGGPSLGMAYTGSAPTKGGSTTIYLIGLPPLANA
jgi:hypothetical protein